MANLITMQPLASVADQELVWVQPAMLNREYELRAGEEIVATLRFQRGSLADAESDGQHWTFKRQGFWHPRVTVREAGAETDLAVFHPRWAGGGTLEMPDGQPFALTAANFWHSAWDWEGRDHALVHFKGRQGLIKARGAVEIDPAARTLPELPLLVLLGWYLILLYAEDAAAAGSAASVAAVTH